MEPNDPRWVQQLDLITAWGEASAINGTPPPTDGELWAEARVRRDLHLPEQIDPGLLADLRAAFNVGRFPNRIDLHAVAGAVTARGIPTRVLDSSGGTATLYTGEETLDSDGDVRFTASAGPGYFAGPGRTNPFADPDEFGIGPHDDSWGIPVPEDATTAQVVDLVIAVTAEADAAQARFATAVAAAPSAMRTALHAAYPDAATTDLPPDLDGAVAADVRRLLARWLRQHWPAYHEPPARLSARGDDQAGNDGGADPAGAGSTQ